MEKHNAWLKISHQIRLKCSDFNHLYFERHRRIDTYMVVSTVLRLVSSPCTAYADALQDLAGKEVAVAPSSFCAARRKVASYFFSEILYDLIEFWDEFNPQNASWYGFQVFAADGSRIIVPRELIREGFPNHYGRYRPQGLLTTVQRISDRTIHAMDFSESFNERQALKRLLERFGNGDLIIYDRGFFSYQFAKEHELREIQAVFRLQGGDTIREIKEFRISSKTDQITAITPSSNTLSAARKAMGLKLLEPITLRLIKYFIKGKTYILATTILDQSIPASDFADLYRKRWLIEELFKVFKQRLSVEGFHSKDRNGIEQELYAAGILWNLTRMLESFASQQHFKKNWQTA